MKTTTTGVIISYYDQYPITDLYRLLDQLSHFPAGGTFQVVIIVNKTKDTPISFPHSYDFGNPLVHYRNNTGYNIGAWDTGWRMTDYFHYLFLQHECVIRKRGWLTAFQDSCGHRGVGLVGESLMRDWDYPWENIPHQLRYQSMPEHEIDGIPTNDRVACYLHHLRAWGIPPGPRGNHLQSLILSTNRQILEEINGFPIGHNYGQAIASEIGISKLVESHGYSLAQVHQRAFNWIAHPQWRRNENRFSGYFKRLRRLMKLTHK